MFPAPGSIMENRFFNVALQMWIIFLYYTYIKIYGAEA